MGLVRLPGPLILRGGPVWRVRLCLRLPLVWVEMPCFSQSGGQRSQEPGREAWQQSRAPPPVPLTAAPAPTVGTNRQTPDRKETDNRCRQLSCHTCLAPPVPHSPHPTLPAQWICKAEKKAHTQIVTNPVGFPASGDWSRASSLFVGRLDTPDILQLLLAQVAGRSQGQPRADPPPPQGKHQGPKKARAEICPLGLQELPSASPKSPLLQVLRWPLAGQSQLRTLSAWLSGNRERPPLGNY